MTGFKKHLGLGLSTPLRPQGHENEDTGEQNVRVDLFVNFVLLNLEDPQMSLVLCDQLRSTIF